MAGSVIVNRASNRAADLVAELDTMRANADLPRIYKDDLICLEANSRTYLVRSFSCQATAAQLAQWLCLHPAVQRVHYPGLGGGGGEEGLPLPDPHYLAVRRARADGDRDQGCGYLVSVVLRPELDTEVLLFCILHCLYLPPAAAASFLHSRNVFTPSAAMPRLAAGKQRSVARHGLHPAVSLHPSRPLCGAGVGRELRRPSQTAEDLGRTGTFRVSSRHFPACARRSVGRIRSEKRRKPRLSQRTPIAT